MSEEKALAIGLTETEVAERVERGLVNMTDDKTSRTVSEIIRTNVLTPFNALLSVLFSIVMVVGQPIDGLFFVAVLINSGMGIVQELRAKRTLDKLTILNTPMITVWRGGQALTVASESVVQDDVVVIRTGDQVPTDGRVQQVDGVEIDESLLTGEVDAVHKQVGDTVLSGSIVVAGTCTYTTTAVGNAAYAHKLASEVKKFTKAHSELLQGTNRLLGYISVIILVVAPILIWGQLVRSGATFQEAAVRSIAAIVGMIPEGLVVLTSFAFVLASLTLARRKVLVQELPAVEGLARVDVICLDKTGTLTEGTIGFQKLELLGNAKETDATAALATFATDANSPTLHALQSAFSEGGFQPAATVPFSSKRKWSAVNDTKQWWVMGAPEIVLAHAHEKVRQHADTIASSGARVLVLVTTSGNVSDKQLPKKLTPQALVILEENVRDDAKATLNYFREQGVALKVISGDNTRTVAAVARRVGLEVDEAYDARDLPTDLEAVAEIIETHSVFGRVLPEQKRLFVKALQSRGHVVAMTGDGVNDALALKDADLGIAMGNGAPATRAVAKIVLLDSKFAHMPHVLAEGRRVIANIERVANLFVIKNVYSLVFALAVTVFALSYPFLPRHLSLISWLTIGIPAFFLALAPNNQRYVPGFLRRVLQFALPVGAVVAAASFYTYTSTLNSTPGMIVASSAAVISVVTIGLWVLVCLARPLRTWKVMLIVTMGLVFVAAISWNWLAGILQFQSLWPYNIRAFLVGILGALLVEVIWYFHEQSRAVNRLADGKAL